MLQALLQRLEFTKGLGFRLGTLLSVAILPIGLISVMQMMHLSREAQRSAELALLGRTTAAAAGERALLQSALGTADALGPAVLELLPTPQACSQMMKNFVERGATYVYAGFTALDGSSDCNSLGSGELLDVSDGLTYQRFMRNPGTLIVSSPRGTVSRQPVVVIGQPLYRDRELLGMVAVSISLDLLRSTHSSEDDVGGARVVTFNQFGEMLSSDDDSGLPADIMPQGETYETLLARSETTFTDYLPDGRQRVFSVVPVVPGLVYALGSWNPGMVGFQGFRLTQMTALLLPIALWIVSLAVAYFAVYRLVLRHIGELRSQMRRFAIGNRTALPRVIREAPAEIADVSQTFHNMARILLRDEAAMEAAVNEKTVLLKEVHHRVKNNLQLIASIINMQSRVIDDPDAKSVLRSVQERVSSLATIYRNLYQAEHLDSVEADRLLSDIVNQMVNAAIAAGSGLKVHSQFDALVLPPDQAVPLSLLATEAITNALKYVGKPAPDEPPFVRVELKRIGTDRARLEVANSLGAELLRTEGTGLGSQLIDAFSAQLEGEPEIIVSESEYLFRLEFRVDCMTVRHIPKTRDVVLTSAARDGAVH